MIDSFLFPELSSCFLDTYVLLLILNPYKVCTRVVHELSKISEITLIRFKFKRKQKKNILKDWFEKLTDLVELMYEKMYFLSGASE